MVALNVGRSTIREVLRKFQALGVIESRKGSGTYLLKPISAATVAYADLHRRPGVARRSADDARSSTRH